MRFVCPSSSAFQSYTNTLGLDGEEDVTTCPLFVAPDKTVDLTGFYEPSHFPRPQSP